MSKWMRLADELTGAGETPANRSNRANSPNFAAIGPIGPNGPPMLPASVSKALASLPQGKSAVFGSSEAWRDVVADARRIAAEGWAAQALALGWSLHDLFSILDDRESLSVWLRGRRMVLVDTECAVAIRPGQRAEYYTRRELPGAKLLWELER